MTETYDPDLLVTFLAVAETGSFSEAARRRGLRQSTVSQHVRRLEAETRRRLFDRDTHKVLLTVDGQALTVLAGEILSAYSRAERYFSNAELRGRVRFGASEDFALSSLLPRVLRAFSSRHPGVDIEMTVGLAADLYEGMDEGALDLIFAKPTGRRRPRPRRVVRGHGLDRCAGLAAKP
jgi:DNA-binding transcriptional LysR family regulator